MYSRAQWMPCCESGELRLGNTWITIKVKLFQFVICLTICTNIHELKCKLDLPLTTAELFNEQTKFNCNVSNPSWRTTLTLFFSPVQWIESFFMVLFFAGMKTNRDFTHQLTPRYVSTLYKGEHVFSGLNHHSIFLYDELEQNKALASLRLQSASSVFQQ